MEEYQLEFIEFAIRHKALCFGEFALKSGRISPYFLNSGSFHDGKSLSALGHFYARAIQDAKLEYNMLFGPAYKGIPLASSVAIALADHHRLNVPYCFNRKEIKDHGEGGITFGAALEGRVVIIDDVISAGTSVKISSEIITQAGASLAGVAVALDRQERGKGKLSAVQEIEQRHAIKVISIATLQHLIKYLREFSDMSENLDNIRKYQNIYGIL